MEPRVQTIRFIDIGSLDEASLEMRRVGVDPVGIKLMASKELYRNLKLTSLTAPAGNIIKQDMLAVGGEAAVSKGVVSAEVDYTDCILSGTLKQFQRLIKKLSIQPYALKGTAKSIETALSNLEKDTYTLKGRSKSWDLGTGAKGSRSLVMGILNVTPDSFSDGGRYKNVSEAVDFGLAMVSQGADIIDVGGESTRPGSEGVLVDEELRRVVPVVEGLVKGGVAVSGAAISIDTTKAEVARRCVALGAEIINDVSAMTASSKDDKAMADVVAETGAAIVLMHMRGTPKDMQSNIEYKDLMGEIFDYLHERVEFALSQGISRDKIIIDPGIGFGKSKEANLEIIRRLGEFRSLGVPIMLGASRKSFMAGADAEKRLMPSIATAVAGVMNGASILRVHDVKETREAVDMAAAIKHPEGVLIKAP